MLSLLRLRWIADAIIVVGCCVVRIGTSLGGYNLKVYIAQSPRLRHRIKSRLRLGGLLLLITPSPITIILLALDLINDGRIDFSLHF